jgi:hypothetical protein
MCSPVGTTGEWGESKVGSQVMHRTINIALDSIPENRRGREGEQGERVRGRRRRGS